jgi:hypothetical protein
MSPLHAKDKLRQHSGDGGRCNNCNDRMRTKHKETCGASRTDFYSTFSQPFVDETIRNKRAEHVLGVGNVQIADPLTSDRCHWGLFYKHGDTAPNTSKVVHRKVTHFQSLVAGDCALNYKKGLIDGEMECSANNGTKIFEANIADEKRFGVEKHWSPESGELTYECSWDGDNKDGVKSIYNATGKTWLPRIMWAEGANVGSGLTGQRRSL